MQRRWHGQKVVGDLLARFGPLIFTLCEIWGVMREDVFPWDARQVGNVFKMHERPV